MSIIELFPAFLLVFIRITAFFVTVPLLAHRTIPAVHRVGFSLFLAVISFSTIKEPPALDIDGLYMMLAVKEAMVGLLLGLIAYIMVSAVQIAYHSLIFKWVLRLPILLIRKQGLRHR